MKPRFSILNLLVVTTYLAVTFAGLLDPEVIGGVSILMIWVAAVIVFASRAAGGPSPRRAFARGLMVGCLICASVAMLVRKPDEAVVNELVQRGVIAPDAKEYDRALGYARLSMAHGSLALGMLSGYVAQRQYESTAGAIS
ncbi:MAG: hypothetical protein SGJ19_24105 [Planctomycetia bacterium]|nr:hypothetical protein [Planctomycetia bacterium]